MKYLIFFFFGLKIFYGNSFIDEFSKLSRSTRIISLGGQVTSDFNGVEAIGTSNPATIYQENDYFFLIYFNNSELYDYNFFTFSALIPITEDINIGARINSLLLVNFLETKNGSEITIKNYNFSNFDFSLSYKIFDFLYLGGSISIVSTDTLVLDKLFKSDIGLLFTDLFFEEINFLQLGIGLRNIDSLLYQNPFIIGDLELNLGITFLLERIIEEEIKVFLELSSLESLSLGIESLLFELLSLRAGLKFPFISFIQTYEHISFSFGISYSFDTKGDVHSLKVKPSYALNFKSGFVENYFQIILSFIPQEEKEEEALSLDDIFE